MLERLRPSGVLFLNRSCLTSGSKRFGAGVAQHRRTLQPFAGDYSGLVGDSVSRSCVDGKTFACLVWASYCSGRGIYQRMEDCSLCHFEKLQLLADETLRFNAALSRTIGKTIIKTLLLFAVFRGKEDIVSTLHGEGMVKEGV